MKTTAVIIARGGSSRLPYKNLLPFHGRPLVAHKVWQLLSVPEIDEVVVGSDDNEILAAAEKEGAVCITRELAYCDEKSRSWNQVIADMLEKVSGDLIVWAHCTNPCIQPHTYSHAIHAYNATAGDSIVGVTAVKSHVWWQNKPLNFDRHAVVHQVAAQLTPVYIQHGGLFIAERALMLREQYVYGSTPALFEISADEAIDIDTQEDFNRARQMYNLVCRYTLRVP